MGLRIDFMPESYKVYGRGELHIAILLENMRREGYEVQVSQPQVIIKEQDGKKLEPFEEVTVDVPEEFSGAVIEKMGRRKGIMIDTGSHGNQKRIIFEIPTRGLLGYQSEFIIDTKGEGICVKNGRIQTTRRRNKKHFVGSMISMASGKASGFSLYNLQERGDLYIRPGDGSVRRDGYWKRVQR